MSIPQSAVVWAQQQPLSGNARSLLLEVAIEAEKTGQQEFDWSDEEVARRLHITTKTARSLHTQVGACMKAQRHEWQQRALYGLRREASSVEKVSPGEKVSPPPSLKISLPLKTIQTEGNKRESSLARPASAAFPDEYKTLLTPAHLEQGKRKGLDEQHVRDELEAFRDFHVARGSTRQDWRAEFSYWLRNARARAAPALWPAGQPTNEIERRNNGNYNVSKPAGRQERTAEEGSGAVADVVAGYSRVV